MITIRHTLNEKKPKQDIEVVLGLITPSGIERIRARYLDGAFYQKTFVFGSAGNDISKHQAKDVAFWEEKSPVEWLCSRMRPPETSGWCVVCHHHVTDWRSIAYYHKDNDMFYKRIELYGFISAGSEPLEVTHYLMLDNLPHQERKDD